MVVKKDGRRESFDRKKLRGGLVKACEKRPVPAGRLDAIVDEIETRLHDTEEREMATRQIGALVMERLRELDKVAYVRFASVYKGFEDLTDFEREVGLLQKTTTPKGGVAGA